MRPVNFPEANRVLRAPPGSVDGAIADLPAWSDGRHNISCWKMSWRDRIRILFTGTVWFWAMGPTHPPILLEVQEPVWGSGREEDDAEE